MTPSEEPCRMLLVSSISPDEPSGVAREHFYDKLRNDRDRSPVLVDAIEMFRVLVGDIRTGNRVEIELNAG
jgi:hypothetical protein